MLNESDVPILKKVLVASGNKVAIGDNIEKALENLVSQYAEAVEVENTDDMEGLIEAIIKANQNLTESNKNNDWEMMGKDVKKLQDLITSLEKTKTEEDKKKQQNNTTNNTVDEDADTNSSNNTSNAITNNVAVQSNTEM